MILFVLKIKTSTPPDFKKDFKSGEEAVDTFKKIDRDGDGKLTRREITTQGQYTQDEVRGWNQQTYIYGTKI